MQTNLKIPEDSSGRSKNIEPMSENEATQLLEVKHKKIDLKRLLSPSKPTF